MAQKSVKQTVILNNASRSLRQLRAAVGQANAATHLRTFVRGSAGTGVAMVARTAGALLLNKLVVLYGGAGGLTQLAQFQTLMGLFGALPTNGVQVGATTYLAPLQVGQPRYRLWLAAAGWLTVLLVGAAGLLLLGLGGPAWPAGRVLFFTGAMLLVSGQALLSGVLLLAGRRGAYVGLMVAVSAAGLVVVAGLLALGQPLGRVLLGYVGGQALVFGLALAWAHRAGLLGGWQQLGLPSRVALRGLLRFVLMAVGTQLFGQAINYALRAYLIRHYTPAATDLWQAVDKLSANYTMAMAMVMSTVFYPRLAALAPRPAEQRHYVSVVAGLLAVSLALGLGLLYWLRVPLLGLLFAPRLAAAANLLGPQLLGDWARFLGWVYQYTLLARGRPGPYLAVQAGASVLYAGLLAGLVPTLGLPGVVDAYAISCGLMLVGCLGWFYSKRL